VKRTGCLQPSYSMVLTFEKVSQDRQFMDF